MRPRPLTMVRAGGTHRPSAGTRPGVPAGDWRRVAVLAPPETDRHERRLAGADTDLAVGAR